MQQWEHTEQTNTAMNAMKDPVVSVFQNQSVCHYLYITTSNSAKNTQSVFQLMFNAQIIELNNLPVTKDDIIFSVSSTVRQREMIGFISNTHLHIYRNEKGKLTLYYKVNHSTMDIRDNINKNSVFYHQTDFILIISNQVVIKLNVNTNSVEQVKLSTSVKSGGSLYIDLQCFYFLGRQQESPASVVACADMKMILASFVDPTKGD